jgi:hypothetical protein
MITPLLRLAFDPVHQRQRRVRRWRLLAVSLGVAAIIAAALLFAGMAVWRVALATVAAFALTRFALGRRMDVREPDYAELARAIETRHPELHAMLLTVVEQHPDPATGKLHLLQQKLIEDAVASSRRLNWVAAVSDTALWRERVFAGCAALVLGFVLFRFGVVERRPVRDAALPEQGVTVTPGDTTVERGSGLIVLADFHRKAPGEAMLIVQTANQPEQRIPLIKNLDDPVFGGGLPEVDSDLTYRIEYAGQATRDFEVKIYEHPRLDRADATLHYPTYTKLPEKTVPDTHRVSAVEGTKLDVKFQLNKPVKSASLVAKDGTNVPLTVSPDTATANLSNFPVAVSETYELKLEDADGRANKIAAQFTVDALKNRPPELKFDSPKGDQQVSAIEEVAFHGHAWDDFGLSRYGITVNVAGRGEQEILLGKDTGADEKREFAHLLKLEDLGVKADDLVSWFLWADDAGPDGGTRRTESDIFFAEVRPFDQIYRRDNGGGGGGGGGEGGEAQKLSELQKQIISATWNLKRAEVANAGPEKPSAKYLKDEPVVRDSQAEALKRAEKAAARFDDAKLQGMADNAKQAMKSALDRLTAAASKPDLLPDALQAEQASYDALLKLAEHEFSVRLSKNQGKEGAQAKQQLDQLELEEDKQKYEAKKEAEPKENQQQREQLAILNRLKELAQRQQDINERLKELQNALQAARTEKEKDEIRRQLKRLREEEQQLLADLDETRQKMEQSAQQSQFADERSQLDKTRGEAQKAAESMDKGETSQALANGTRTQHDLQELRDEFRKKTSGQFNEEMRQMRNNARDLATAEEEIADKLKPKPEPAPDGQKRRTLETEDQRGPLEEKLAKQQADLGQLTRKMQVVSDQAENVEPLLAKELYDALRKTTQAGTGDTLEKTQQLAQLGNNQDAEKFEEKARKEIEDLKGGVERAAESVLGDEAEALRQARAELDSARKELEREIAHAQPELAEGAAQQGGQQPAAQSGSTKNGQQPAEQGTQPAEARAQAGVPKPQQAGNQRESETGIQAGEQPGKDGSGKGQTASQGQEQKGDQGKGQGQGQDEKQSGQTAQSSEGKGKDGAAGERKGEGAGSGAAKNSENAQAAGGDLSRSDGGQRAGEQLRALAGQAREIGGDRYAGADGGGGAAGGGGFDGGYGGGPLTGEQFVEWSDRLRNVEEMVDDPALRAEVARVREIAKGMRIEFKQHQVMPKWDIVKSKIGAPLAELRNRLTEELARRESKENLVPIDRDPVPAQYAERVRRYYEELGRSR